MIGFKDVYERLERIEKLLDNNTVDDTDLKKRVVVLEKEIIGDSSKPNRSYRNRKWPSVA